MDEKRYYDTQLDDKQQLFYDSLSEIAQVLGGQSLHNPLSVSLLCLSFGITHDEKGKLLLAFLKTVLDHEPDQLSVQLFRKAIEDIIPAGTILGLTKYSDLFVEGLIKAFARNYIPELVPFASTLES